MSVCLALPTLPAGSGAEATTAPVPSPRGAGVVFHVPLACRSVVIVCLATDTVTVVPGEALEVPVIVGSTSLVVAVLPPVIVTTGGTVLIVSCWVALPVLPAPSITDATTG